MWLTALVIGFAGSMHCLGMCSPLVLSVTGMNPSAIVNRLLYNGGRITTYAVIGAAVSSAGMILPLQQYQNLISIVLGIAMLLIGFGGVRSLRAPLLTTTVRRVTAIVKNLFAKYLRRKTPGAIFFLGTLNGMLPCGLTLVALTWCLTLKGPLDGFNFMLLFGVGTLPVMLGLTGGLAVLVKKFHWNLQKLTTSMLIVSGCILIARVFIVHLPHTMEGNGRLIDVVLCR